MSSLRDREHALLLDALLEDECRRRETDLLASDFGHEEAEDLVAAWLQTQRDIDEKYKALFTEFSQVTKALVETMCNELRACATRHKREALNCITEIHVQTKRNQQQREKLAELEASKAALFPFLDWAVRKPLPVTINLCGEERENDA